MHNRLLYLVEGGFLDEEWKLCEESGISFQKTKEILEDLIK